MLLKEKIELFKYKIYFSFRRFVIKNLPRLSKKLLKRKPWTFSDDDWEWVKEFAELLKNPNWDEIYSDENSAFEEIDEQES